MRGSQTTQNYLLEGRLLVVQPSPARQGSGNLSVSVDQLALLWEAAFGFSEFFFWKTQHVWPFHDGWLTSTPAHTTLSVQQFCTKNRTIPWAPPSLFTLSCPWGTFVCFPRWKKLLRGKCFPDVEEVKQKMAETLKGITINEFENFWTVEKTSW